MSSIREERHELTRKRILEAALELIDRDGIQKFSLRAVARKVKYSPAGLYEYFDNKDDIVGTLCQAADEKLALYLSAVSDEIAYPEHMVELGLAYIAFAQEEATYFRLNFVTQMSGRKSMDEEVAQGAYTILLESVQSGVDTGQFATSEDFGAEQIAYSLWSIVHGMALLQASVLSELDMDFKAVNHEGLRRFISGMMSG